MDFEKLFNQIVAKFIGTKHERDIKRISPLVVEISALASEYERMSDEQLAARNS